MQRSQCVFSFSLVLVGSSFSILYLHTMEIRQEMINVFRAHAQVWRSVHPSSHAETSLGKWTAQVPESDSSQGKNNSSVRQSCLWFHPDRFSNKNVSFCTVLIRFCNRHSFEKHSSPLHKRNEITLSIQGQLLDSFWFCAESNQPLDKLMSSKITSEYLSSSPRY